MNIEDVKSTTIIEIPANEIREVISIDVICRLCANQSDKLIGIYSEEGLTNDLANKMNLYLPIKVSETDSLPLQCCWNCASTLLAWHDLVITTVEADRRLRSYQFVIGKQLITTPESYDTSVVSSIEQTNQSLPKVNDEDSSQENDENIEASNCEFDNTDEENVQINKDHNKCSACEKSRETENISENNLCNLEKQTRDDKAINPSNQKLCKQCDTTFETGRTLSKHMQEVHNYAKKFRQKKKDLTLKFFCYVCSKGFTRKYDMQRHFTTQHPNDTLNIEIRPNNKELLDKCRIPNPNTDNNKKYKWLFKCDFCDKFFKESYTLVTHRRIHTTKENVYFCDICGKGFKHMSYLMRHIKLFHKRIKNFKCDICDRTFPSRSGREEHMNSHTDNRPFVCDICGKAFRQSASLHTHNLFHKNVFPFECEVCGKTFRRNHDRKTHMLLHTGEKPHHCSICGGAFRMKQDLKRHMRVHNKLDEYECDVCSCKFSQEGYLKSHKRVHVSTSHKNCDRVKQLR